MAATKAPAVQVSPIAQHYAYLLTETDLKAITALQLSDLPRSAATVLYVLYRYGPTNPQITSHWIERVADLRQPEVSIAMAILIGAGIVKASKKPIPNKGRPVKVYRVVGNIPEYIRIRMVAKEREIAKALAEIHNVFPEVN
jgi:predicted transcriptional regulator